MRTTPSVQCHHSLTLTGEKFGTTHVWETITWWELLTEKAKNLHFSRLHSWGGEVQVAVRDGPGGPGGRPPDVSVWSSENFRPGTELHQVGVSRSILGAPGGFPPAETHGLLSDPGGVRSQFTVNTHHSSLFLSGLSALRSHCCSLLGGILAKQRGHLGQSHSW